MLHLVCQESESVEEMATLTKSHGIEIIGVGVGYNVKVPMELLLKVISTTPDRRDYFYGVQKFIQIYDRDLSHIESMAQYICVRGKSINQLTLKHWHIYFSIWNHHKCLSWLFPIHFNTYAMGLWPLEIF